MLPELLLRLVRRLTLRARHTARGRLAGAYESAIRGVGLTFADVRPYQPGDDVRHFDWNVTARTGSPHIKRFVEEREQTVWLAMDASGSLDFGTKRRCAAEVAALLAFAAVAQGDRVGLIHFTDTAEQVLLPGKGDRHARRVVRELFTFRGRSRQTNLTAPLALLRRRRRGIVFVFSDFLDAGGESALRTAARKHDLIGVVVRDPAEEALLNVGLVNLADAETGQQVLIDTRKQSVREAYQQAARQRFDAVAKMLRSAGADRIDVTTAGGHLEALLAFFHRRETRR